MLFGGAAEGRAAESKCLHGLGRRLSVGAVKAAGFAFIGAQRRALTEEAGGSGAGFGQEGQVNLFSGESRKGILEKESGEAPF